MTYYAVMDNLFCLFTITSNSCYITIAGSQPTQDEELLEQIRSLIIKIRPGHGKSWAAAVLQVDGGGSLTKESQQRLQFIRSGLS